MNKCDHDDCFTCPYPDCDTKRKRKPKDRTKYQHDYYLANRDQLRQKMHDRYMRRKYG